MPQSLWLGSFISISPNFNEQGQNLEKNPVFYKESEFFIFTLLLFKNTSKKQMFLRRFHLNNERFYFN